VHNVNSSSSSSTPWIISQQDLQHLPATVIATLFSVGNGFIGTRGTSSINSAEHTGNIDGTYANGFFVKKKIHYDESAYGFAQYNDTLLQLPETKKITLYYADQLFSVSKVISQTFDLKRALVTESLLLCTPSNQQLRVDISRFISLVEQQLMVHNFSITALNFTGNIKVIFNIDHPEQAPTKTDDPRLGNLSVNNYITEQHDIYEQTTFAKVQRFNLPHQLVISAITPKFDCAALDITDKVNEHSQSNVCYQLNVNTTACNVTLYSYYQVQILDQLLTDESVIKTAIADNANTAINYLAQVSLLNFNQQLTRHHAHLAKFWQDGDIEIVGEPAHQLAIRLNLLHLYMSCGKNGDSNIAAKGLTGPGYDGHYFWDSEIYIVPFFLFSQPDIAKNLLSYRFHKLANAKQRAKELGHQTGALFAWRTISGDECSSYFPAGTAQYHINSAIAYAVKQYFQATEDWQFMCEQGAELVFETARLWPSLGHISTQHQGQFCIDTVTGPDEYSALVNNNYYTNSMAKLHLQFACDLATQLQQHRPEIFQQLTERLALTTNELAQWQNIANTMYLPFDQTRNIHAQDDSFLGKKRWDFENTSQDKYPLLLNFHPLVIYRHQVLKQADVVLADVLLDQTTSVDIKRNNINYYEPLTTHDSTLSACIHSIAYCDLNELDKAYQFFEETLMTDIENRHLNSHYGIHTAAMGGSWLCIVQGFAGFRLRDKVLTFAPKLPTQWKKLTFKLTVLACQIQISIDTKQVTYQLLSGTHAQLMHRQHAFELSTQQPSVTLAIN